MSNASYDLSQHTLWLGDAPKNWEPSWLVEHIWQVNGLSFLSGSPKSHKSILRRYCMACALANQPVFEVLEVQESVGRILVFLAEDHPGAERKQLDAILDAFGMAPAKDRVCFVRPHGFVFNRRIHCEGLLKFLEAEAFDLIAWDPFIRFHTSAENDSKEMSDVFRFLDILKQDHTLSMIHHGSKPNNQNGKDRRTTGEKSRGSSTIPAAADVSLFIDRIGKTQTHTLSFESKNLREPDDFRIILDPDTWLWSMSTPITEEGVLVTVRENPGITNNQLAERLNIGTGTASKYLTRLFDKHLVTVREGKRHAKHYHVTT
jgi:RecA-family ATPase